MAATVQAWTQEKRKIAASFRAHMRNTAGIVRSRPNPGGGYHYSSDTIESDLLAFGGLVVQVCEAWSIAGTGASAEFRALYDPTQAGLAANEVREIELIRKACDYLLGMVRGGAGSKSIEGFWRQPLPAGGHARQPPPAQLVEAAIPAIGNVLPVEEMFHLLRTVRNSWSHANVHYLYGQNVQAVLPPPSAWGDFTNPRDFPAGVSGAPLVMIDYDPRIGWPADPNRRAIITLAMDVRYHMHLFLEALSSDICFDVFGNIQ